MYTTINFKSKKALIEAVKAGKQITYYQPFLGDTPMNGKFCCEGPHYPEPHTWYASCEAKNGVIVKVK